MRQQKPNDPAQTSFETLLFYPTAEEKEAQAAREAPLQPSPFEGATLPVYRVALVRERDQPLRERIVIRQPQDAAKLFSALLRDKDREHFVLLMLDTKNRVIGLNTVSIGRLDSALVAPREVFKPALLCNAASIIICHNHPSGDPMPSDEDKRVTQRLADAGKLLAIEVLDHLIVGEADAFCSLKEMGAF